MVRRREHREPDPEHDQTASHSGYPDKQQWLSPYSVDQPHCQDGQGDVDYADDEVRVDRARLRKPDVGQRGRGVIDDRVDPDELLKHRQSGGDYECRPYPLGAQQSAQSGSAFLGVIDFTDLVDALLRPIVSGQVLQNLLRGLLFARVYEVARCLRHEEHAYQQHE